MTLGGFMDDFWEGKMESYSLMGTKFQFYKMKRVTEMDSGDGYTLLCMYFIPRHCILKDG